MKFNLLIVCFLLTVAVSLAQSKTKPVVTKAVPELQTLFTASSLPFNIVNNSEAIIAYGEENLASYPIPFQKTSDLYIIYSNTPKTIVSKIDDTKYKYLLQQNDHFDLLKIGMSSEYNNIYVKADIYKATITALILTRIIQQDANVTNIVAEI